MKKKKSGFTLLEMIIVLALTVLIIGIASSIFMTGNKVFADSDVKTTLQMEAKDIQEKISNACMEASYIQVVSKDKAKIIFNDEYGNKAEIIQIEKDGLSLYWIPGDKYDNLFNDKKQILTTHLNMLKIETNSNLISFNFLLHEKKGYSDVTYPVEFSITLRNKQ